MSINDTGLSNFSYTNKDFNSIYNELLDLGDRISPKWKPSQSNESDPGILLLKMDAIIGDKNNYNIDKNILELFPSSVTQYPAAREIFEQCGYIMPYYRAAEAIVSINMTSEPEGVTKTPEEGGTVAEIQNKENTRLYTLKDFTMLCNEDNSIVYTIVDSYPYLTSNGATYQYKALQGIVNTYALNNSELITYNSLDYNNRIYFKEANIAENGIFIENINNNEETRNYSDWVKVDNLMTEPLNTKCFKFGLSKDTSKCYIEFPNDIANLIGEGLKIRYITTSGYDGNISSNTLNKFFEDIDSYVTLASDTQRTPDNRYTNGLSQIDQDLTKTYSLTTENVYIRNVKPSSNGADPETISEARRNYERTKNTFETLVSLDDYNNFLLNSDQLSNGFICNRSNDIQASTKIITSDGSIETLHTQVKNKELKYDLEGTLLPDSAADSDVVVRIPTPELSAFDLRIYALKYINPVTTESALELTFDLASEPHLLNFRDDMQDIKCIQHDFKDLNTDDIIYIQLRYPIKAKIIPYNKLETLQQYDIQSKVIRALSETLNANELEFGAEIDYDKVYDTIMGSDNRIKSLILDDFDYEAYIIFKALYLSNRVCTFKIPENYTEMTINELDTYIGTQVEALKLDTYAEHYKSIFKNWLYTIHAKAILSGVTPLLDTGDYNFNYSVLNKGGQILADAGKVKTESTIRAKIDSNNKCSIELTPNESIYLTTNNFITKETYANYVKYFYAIKDSITSDGLYELRGAYTTKSEDVGDDGEASSTETAQSPQYIIFFWKEKDGDTEPYQYAKYVACDEESEELGPIISPNFHLNSGDNLKVGASKSSGLTKEAFVAAEKIVEKILQSDSATGTVPDWEDIELTYKDKTYKANQIIARCSTGTILSGTKTITIKDKNSITLSNRQDDKTKITLNKVYWILNDSEIDPNTNESVYKLTFDTSSTEHTYTLKTGEYLFYSDSEAKTFSMLGAGTKLIARDFNTYTLSVKARSYEEIIYGVNDLLTEQDLWYNLVGDNKIDAYEMMFYNIGSGSTVTFESLDSQKWLSIDSTKCVIKESNTTSTSTDLPSDCKIKYSFEGSTIQLPQINVNKAKWEGHTILNLDCGPEKEQTLYSANSETFERTQSITITHKLNKTDGTYRFESLTEPLSIDTTDGNNKTFQSNYAIQALGGDSIDVSAYTLSGARYNNAFYSYIKEALSNDALKEEAFNTELTISLTSDSEDTPYSGIGTITLQKPANISNTTTNYLLTVLSYKNHNTVIINNGTTGLTAINDADLSTKGLKFFALSSNAFSDDELTLTISVTNLDTDKSRGSRFKFLPFTPYTNETEIGLTNGDASNTLASTIKTLDEQKQFNYGHIVSQDVLIEDPLAAYSFLDRNHPYNQATICKWDYKNSNIKITNKIK